MPTLLESLQTVNDVHSQLNRTRVKRIERPRSVGELQRVVLENAEIAVAGGKHAMGGQQFASDGVLLDTRGMSRILKLDHEAGVVEVEAGIQWPQLVNQLQRTQWGIRQKQTGADRLSLGGALAANIHGRGLTMRPIVGDVEAFTLIDARGELKRCRRVENRELFSLAIGGYGLFGIIYSVSLRLSRRQKLERRVAEISIQELMPAFEARIAEGFLYGDLQFAIDDQSDVFLQRGVFSCYRPVNIDTPMPAGQKELGAQDWCDLIHLAHVDKSTAYRKYADYYLKTSGQVYWSDLHQMSVYLDDYHGELDAKMGGCKASEVITELYVPRGRLAEFMTQLASLLREERADLIYGTVRLIEKDTESFLAWARENFACVVLNLHVVHQKSELARAAHTFRAMIDLSAKFGGSFYLTYHRHATLRQVEKCYPQFERFLELKLTYDPQEKFSSDWYRHYRDLFKMEQCSSFRCERRGCSSGPCARTIAANS